MTAGHPQWEMPARGQWQLYGPSKRGSARELTIGERSELKTAVERMARCATGMLRLDAHEGWYIPEQKSSGACARLAAENQAPEE
jgi:hypothetical protein